MQSRNRKVGVESNQEIEKLALKAIKKLKGKH
jgi:hypothetical protein